MQTAKELTAANNDYIVACRHWMHEHPERSHEEKETAAFIASELREMGLEPKENIGGYGVTAVIEGKPGGKCVGLRADFDALPILEKTGASFCSKNEGVMHACGHDTHAAMLLGAAKVLMSMRESFFGKVKLVFQPSEEDAAGSGAKRMIEDGCLDNPKVDMMFGQHVWPRVEKGYVGIRKGAVSAASDRFFIDIKGRASHAGAAPEKGVDAVVIAAQIINALETVVSRCVSPLDSAVLSIGILQAGSRYNIVADHGHMEGTVRTLNPEVRMMMPARMKAIVENVAAALGGEASLDYRTGFSSVWNASEAVEGSLPALEKVFTKGGVIFEDTPDLSGEDFCFFGEHVPACFFHIGCREENMTAPLHAENFLPSDDILPLGTECLVEVALNYLS